MARFIKNIKLDYKSHRWECEYFECDHSRKWYTAACLLMPEYIKTKKQFYEWVVERWDNYKIFKSTEEFNAWKHLS